MDDSLLKLVASLDVPQSTSKLNEEIKNLKLNPIKVSTTLDTSDIKSEIEKVTKTQKPKATIEADLEFDKNKLSKSIDLALEKIKNNPAFSELSEKLRSVQSEIQDADKIKLTNLNKEFSSVNQSIRLVSEATKQANSEIKLGLEKARFSNSVEKWAQDNSKSLKALGLDIDNILAQVQSADRIKMDALKTEFEDVKSRAREAGLEGKTFGDTIKESLGRLTAYFSVAAMFGMATNEVRKMISTVQELNKVTVDLQIASGYTKEQVAGLMDTYNQLGQRIGATTVEIGKSADSWLNFRSDV